MKRNGGQARGEEEEGSWPSECGLTECGCQADEHWTCRPIGLGLAHPPSPGFRRDRFCSPLMTSGTLENRRREGRCRLLERGERKNQNADVFDCGLVSFWLSLSIPTRRNLCLPCPTGPATEYLIQNRISKRTVGVAIGHIF